MLAVLVIAGIVTAADLTPETRLQPHASYASAVDFCQHVVLDGVPPAKVAASMGLKLTPLLGGGVAAVPTLSDIFFGATTRVRMVDATPLDGGLSSFFVTVSEGNDKCMGIVRVRDGAAEMAHTDRRLRVRKGAVAVGGAVPASGGDLQAYSVVSRGRRYVVTNSWGLKDNVTKALISIRPET